MESYKKLEAFIDVMGIEINFNEKVDWLKQTLLDLIPTRKENSIGQLPMILYHQANRKLHFDVSWGMMQLAYNQLHDEHQVFPEQNFKRSIIKRTCKVQGYYGKG